MTTLKCNEINVNEIKYNEPKQNQHGGNMVGMSYNNSKITMQIPRARVPFGHNSMTTEKNEIRRSLDISFSGLENNESLQEFYDWVRDLDARNKNMAVQNCEKWLKRKNISLEVVEELYKPLINDKSEGKYPATMRFKLPTNNEGEFTGNIFAPDRTPMTLDDVTKGSDVSLIVEIQPMWFVNKMFGVTFKVVQMKLYKKQALTEYAFRDDDDDEVSVAQLGAAASSSTGTPPGSPLQDPED